MSAHDGAEHVVAGKLVICDVHSGVSAFDPTFAEQRANAALIAAAPDLYEALQETLSVIESEFQVNANVDTDGSHIATSMRSLWLSARAALSRAQASDKSGG